jgi:hypothetical protein
VARLVRWLRLVRTRTPSHQSAPTGPAFRAVLGRKDPGQLKSTTRRPFRVVLSCWFYWCVWWVGELTLSPIRLRRQMLYPPELRSHKSTLQPYGLIELTAPQFPWSSAISSCAQSSLASPNQGRNGSFRRKEQGSHGADVQPLVPFSQKRPRAGQPATQPQRRPPAVWRGEPPLQAVTGESM